MSQGLFDSIALPSSESGEQKIQPERLLLAAAAMSAGHRGRDAVVEADLVLSILRGKPEKRRSAQQEAVRTIELIFADYQQAPPKPQVIARWIKTMGDCDRLAVLIRSLGDSGHLDKGHAYVFAAVSRQGGESSNAPRPQASAAGLAHGTELPTGMIWSATAGRAMTRQEFESEVAV
jgi:hypothetical protein